MNVTIHRPYSTVDKNGRIEWHEQLHEFNLEHIPSKYDTIAFKGLAYEVYNSVFDIDATAYHIYIRRK